MSEFYSTNCIVYRPSLTGSPAINKLNNSTSEENLTKSVNNLDLTPSFEDNPLLTKYSKSHSFKTHTFKGLNWCELCANFLWGFTAQGVKCEGKINFMCKAVFNSMRHFPASQRANSTRYNKYLYEHVRGNPACVKKFACY